MTQATSFTAVLSLDDLTLIHDALRLLDPEDYEAATRSDDLADLFDAMRELPDQHTFHLTAEAVDVPQIS